jgi:bacteriorhodopsin
MKATTAVLAAFLFAGTAFANNALELNPPNADASITVRGSDWLFAVTAFMGASAIGVTAWGMTRPGKYWWQNFAGALLIT